LQWWAPWKIDRSKVTWARWILGGGSDLRNQNNTDEAMKIDLIDGTHRSSIFEQIQQIDNLSR
jgi:hypothetical protein